MRTGLADPFTLRALAVGLISEVLIRGLMIAGDIGDRGFQPWPGAPADSIARVCTSWLTRTGPRVSIGEVGWLSNTPDGEYLGRLVLEREGHG